MFLDEHSKDAWYYDEQDMLDMDAYEEPDPDSDYDYEESYSSKRKRRKTRGGGHHPARSHPPSTDTPGGKRTKVSHKANTISINNRYFKITKNISK